MSTTAPLPRSRMRATDVGRSSWTAMRARPTRTGLSMLGVAIGIAALVAVMGLSSSSRADLSAQLDTLGTDLLVVEPGGALGAAGGDAQLATEATAMIEAIVPVEAASGITNVTDIGARTSAVVPEGQTGGVSVAAADPDLLNVLHGGVASGRWIDQTSTDHPVVVLGAVAAERLGVTDANGTQAVVLGDETFTVVGVLEPFPLAADLDRMAFVGRGAAATLFDIDQAPSRVYLRVPDADQLEPVRDVLPATANPESPQDVSVSRPSDALAAQLAAESAFNTLLIGLGSVALLVGGIGIANVMVIAVIERRGEIGLRRALGGTRLHITLQFLWEAVALAGLGGALGAGLGAAITAGYARHEGWTAVIPAAAVVGGVLAALVIGALAGLYPATRAAALPPTEALRAA